LDLYQFSKDAPNMPSDLKNEHSSAWGPCV